MLPHCMGEFKLRQNINDFESAREISMKEDDKTVVRRRFERIYNEIESKSNMKHKEVLQNNEIFIYGFKRKKTDKIEKNLSF